MTSLIFALLAVMTLMVRTKTFYGGMSVGAVAGIFGGIAWMTLPL